MLHYKTVYINSKILAYEYVNKFAVYLNDCGGYICSGYEVDGNPIYMLPWGETKIMFEDNCLILVNLKIGPPVATASDIEQLAEISIYGEETTLTNFLIEAKKFCKKSEEDFIDISILRGSWWQKISNAPKRKMDTIYLSQKAEIILDVQKFLKSEDIYLEMGIPWKRNYLFSGPPGVGKTTLIFGLASLLNFGVCVINFSPKTDDAALINSLTKIESSHILILEDIDCLFVERRANDALRSSVSFSGILNLLDGIIRKHGLITVMTTNHPERLDPALLRPGRVDNHIKFDYMTIDCIKQMCQKILPKSVNIAEEKEILKTAEKLKLSPAQLQEFLFKYREVDTLLPHLDELEKLDCSQNGKVGGLYS
tara:strand:+ start:1515 stop:2618 length:1104 start_codon:yes stop_codon:yes gene_type:complete